MAPIGDAPDHGDLRRPLEGVTLDGLLRRLLIDGDRLDEATQIPVERETDLPELHATPGHDPGHEPLRRGPVLGEPLVVGWQEPISVAQLAGDAELPDGDDPGVFQGVLDRGPAWAPATATSRCGT
jgi:hypothetical protein